MSDIEQEAHWLDRNQDYWQARAKAAERRIADEQIARENEDSHWANIYAQACTRYERAEAKIEALREVLQLIASPMRPDGTYNRDRRACEELARKALAILDGEGEK